MERFDVHPFMTHDNECEFMTINRSTKVPWKNTIPK
jgi:hypothetical protein